MAFRASLATQQSALSNAMQQALWIKGICQSAASALSGTVNADQVFQLVDNIRAVLGMLNTDAVVPGIAAYAQAQLNDSTYNVSTEFNTLVSDLNAVVSWVVTNFPKDAQGFAQAHTLNADGSRAPATFTSTQTAGLTTALNAVIAQIS